MFIFLFNCYRFVHFRIELFVLVRFSAGPKPHFEAEILQTFISRQKPIYAQHSIRLRHTNFNGINTKMSSCHFPPNERGTTNDIHASTRFNLSLVSANSFFMVKAIRTFFIRLFHNNRIHFYHLDPFAIEIKSAKCTYLQMSALLFLFYFTLGWGREIILTVFYNHN